MQVPESRLQIADAGKILLLYRERRCRKDNKYNFHSIYRNDINQEINPHGMMTQMYVWRKSINKTEMQLITHNCPAEPSKTGTLNSIT